MAGGLEKGDGGVLQGGREIGGLLMEIEAEAEQGKGRLVGAGDGFDQNAGELAIFEEEIVGPLEVGLELGQGANGIGRGEGGEKRKEGKLGGREFQKEGYPKAEGGVGVPRVARAAAAGGLNFCGENGGWGRKRGAEVILGGGNGRKDRDAGTKGRCRGKKEVDLGGLEGIGGFRGRNCRRS